MGADSHSETVISISGSVSLCGISLEDYFRAAEKMHGNLAPGLVIGGFMVDLARSKMDGEAICDVVVETSACLPDAVQILTPCSTGNGWMKIKDVGKYALTMYDKFRGHGVRVWLDCKKLDPFPDLKEWFLKLKPKKEQSKARIVDDMLQAGSSVLSCRQVFVPAAPKRRKGAIGICERCGEAYPVKDGPVCLQCQGRGDYYRDIETSVETRTPEDPLHTLPVEECVGKPLTHDITKIVPGEFKGPEFRKGYVVQPGDVCRLQQLGKRHLYVVDETKPGFIHENDAILKMAKAIAGPGISYDERPREGKINFRAAIKGLFLVNREALLRFNLIKEVMCATRHRFSLVERGDQVAGARAIPLMAHEEQVEAASMIASNAGGLISVVPLRKARVGLIITGNEIFQGVIKDRFKPIIQEKLNNLGSSIAFSKIVPDDSNIIASTIEEMLGKGADLIVTTAGLSVDPDDVTRKGVAQAGASKIVYGSAVLPGSMAMVAKIGEVPILGVPACGLYFKTTIMDLLLPRILAGMDVSEYDLAEMGHGGFCLTCKTCRFPRCSFGKI